jgi:hypothetical protein
VPEHVDVLGLWADGDRYLYLIESQMRDSHRHVSARWRYECITGAGHGCNWTGQTL